jgi:3-hydroxybutyryl-CoA dehydrogenase
MSQESYGDVRRPIGVVGGGTMGVGIAYVFAAAGHDVELIEPSPTRRAAVMRELHGAAEDAVRRDRLTSASAVILVERITVAASVEDLATGLDLVVESVPESIELKCSVLHAVEQRSPQMIATNTSSIPIGALAAALQHPDVFIGMHFFNPVWSLKLVELVRGASTSEETVERAQCFAAGIGKESIVSADVAGFATSRFDFAAALEAMRMLEDGVATADDIDRAATLAYRHPVGPLRLSDIVGLDVRLDIARLLEQSYGERFRPPRILVDLVEAGHLGRKTGRGFHRWES